MKETGIDTSPRSPQSHAQQTHGQDQGRAGPSKHGAILGDAIALIEMAGRKDSPVELPPMCLTCAFRSGSMPNQTAATGMIALDCVLGIDKDRFACHHGMKNGEPQKLCVGYLAARLAPFSFTKKVLLVLAERLAKLEGPDEIQAAFNAWLAEADPTGAMDEYKLARAYATRSNADNQELDPLVTDDRQQQSLPYRELNLQPSGDR